MGIVMELCANAFHLLCCCEHSRVCYRGEFHLILSFLKIGGRHDHTLERGRISMQRTLENTERTLQAWSIQQRAIYEAGHREGLLKGLSGTPVDALIAPLMAQLTEEARVRREKRINDVMKVLSCSDRTKAEKRSLAAALSRELSLAPREKERLIQVLQEQGIHLEVTA